MPKEPYDLSLDRIKINARVPVTEHYYLRRRFPAHGIYQTLLATLYKNVIDELKRIESELGRPLEQAWYIDSPTHAILDNIVERMSVGLSIGVPARRDDERTASGIREAMQRLEILSADLQSYLNKGECGTRSEKEVEGDEGQRKPSPRSPSLPEYTENTISSKVTNKALKILRELETSLDEPKQYPDNEDLDIVESQ